jgi:hypothetical protein
MKLKLFSAFLALSVMVGVSAQAAVTAVQMQAAFTAIATGIQTTLASQNIPYACPNGSATCQSVGFTGNNQNTLIAQYDTALLTLVVTAYSGYGTPLQKILTTMTIGATSHALAVPYSANGFYQVSLQNDTGNGALDSRLITISSTGMELYFQSSHNQDHYAEYSAIDCNGASVPAGD